MLSRALLLAVVVLLAGCGSGDGQEGNKAGRPPIALALRADGPFKVGTQVQLEVLGVHSDGSEERLDSGTSFASSDERIARVDGAGRVSLIAGGPAHLTVQAAGLEASLDIRATCAYPANDGELAHGKVIPPLSWPARRPDGTSFELRLEDVYCDADWAHVETLALLFYAGWCPYCTEMARELVGEFPALNDKGMELVFVLVETTRGDPAGLDFAWEHMKRITDPVPGIVVGDADSRPVARAVASAGIIRGFPTTVVVRTSDMKIITGVVWTGSNIPLADIADAPDDDWGVFANRCPGDVNPGEWTNGVGNDRIEDATPIGIGVHESGICFERDLDYYVVEHDGPWTAELRWDPAISDPLTIMGYGPADEPAVMRLEAAAVETRRLSMEGRGRLLVKAAKSHHSGLYTLEITER